MIEVKISDLSKNLCDSQRAGFADAKRDDILDINSDPEQRCQVCIILSGTLEKHHEQSSPDSPIPPVTVRLSGSRCSGLLEL